MTKKHQDIITRLRAISAEIRELEPSAKWPGSRADAVNNLEWAVNAVQLLAGTSRRGKVRVMSKAEREQRQAEYDDTHEPSLQDQGMVPDGLSTSIGDY